MTAKQNWFALMRKIGEASRDAGVNYLRCFSEPRKQNGLPYYRTKFWGVSKEEFEVMSEIGKHFGLEAEEHRGGQPHVARSVVFRSKVLCDVQVPKELRVECKELHFKNNDPTALEVLGDYIEERGGERDLALAYIT